MSQRLHLRADGFWYTVFDLGSMVEGLRFRVSGLYFRFGI
jgi:hypothetical protein